MNLRGWRNWRCWRYWRIILATKLLTSLLFSAALLIYSERYPTTALGMLAFVLGIIALLALTFYVIRYVFRATRRSQRAGLGQREDSPKVVDYERFRQKRGVG